MEDCVVARKAIFNPRSLILFGLFNIFDQLLEVARLT